MTEQHEERKQNIIDAAIRVMSKQGFHRFTFRQVAAEAGISPGTLHYYYNSKNLILYDILDHTSTQAVRLANEMKAGPWAKDEVYSRIINMFKNQVMNEDSNKVFLHLLHESLSDDELSVMIIEKYHSWIESMHDIFVMYFGISASPMSQAITIVIEAFIDGLSMMQVMGIDVSSQSEIIKILKYFLNADLKRFLQEA